MVTVQSLDDLERQVAVAELELPAIETAHHVDSAKLVELEDLAGTIDEILAIVKADPGGQQTLRRLEHLRARMVEVLGRVVRILH